MDELEKLSDEEVERIAKKIIELQSQKKEKSKITSIAKKYRPTLSKRFDKTYDLEVSIRTVACALGGYRNVQKLSDEKVDEVCSYMEELYKKILKEENNND